MNIPKETIDSALKVQRWFSENGHEKWAIFGICSRNHVPSISKELPTEPGFYWWRGSDKHEWILVKAVSSESGKATLHDLAQYNWEPDFSSFAVSLPSGEWVKANKPL